MPWIRPSGVSQLLGKLNIHSITPSFSRPRRIQYLCISICTWKWWHMMYNVQGVPTWDTLYIICGVWRLIKGDTIAEAVSRVYISLISNYALHRTELPQDHLLGEEGLQTMSYWWESGLIPIQLIINSKKKNIHQISISFWISLISHV